VIYVVGSGPAGISAADALARRGLLVTILDGGLTLEPERRIVVERLKCTPHKNWTSADIASLSNALKTDARSIQVKHIFGSDYPYREAQIHIPIVQHGLGSVTPSLARGGFSNVWGAAVMPYTERDLAGWPISLRDLEPHYRGVLEFMPLSSRRDGLERNFPAYVPTEKHVMPVSSQIQTVLGKLSKSCDYMEAVGLSFGISRLAVRSGCIRCGLCMYGCPFELIYSTQQTLEQLLQLPNVRYIPNVIIQRVEERNGQVELHGYYRISKEKLKFSGNAAFLAAGVLATSTILLRSLGRENIEHELRVSEYFLLPLLSPRRFEGVSEEELHTLSQMFLECTNSAVSSGTIHMQLYGYIDLYRKALRSMFAKIPLLSEMLVSTLAERMFVIQGYLHSDESSVVTVNLGEDGVLRLNSRVNPAARRTIERVVKVLGALRKGAGLWPIRLMLRIGSPGEGRHFGGTFPMATVPRDGETDIHGRPRGFNRIFVVDSTVFPSVPAPTITFTIMANARRIASSYAAQAYR
jgi:choline dehydrogenase-like flavoprotein